MGIWLDGGGAGTLWIHSSGNTINGTVYRSGSGVNVTAEDLLFNGAFAVIDDLDV